MPLPNAWLATALCCGLALLGGCEPLDEPERVEPPRLASGASEPRALELPTLPPTPPPPAPAPAPAPPRSEPASRSRVEVSLTRIQATVEREQIHRLMTRLATRCHADDPQLRGTMTFAFALTGNQRGPTQPRVRASAGLERASACMRRAMETARWPTGLICGVGIFEVRVRFR